MFLLVLLWYAAVPNFRYKCNERGVRACETDDDALGGDPSFEVLKCGGLHLVVTEVVPVGGGADNNNNNNKKSSCAVQYLNERLKRV